MSKRSLAGSGLAFTVAALAFAGAMVQATPAAAQPIALGAAESFAALAGTAVSNTGASTLAGDVGVGLGGSVAGFPPGTVDEASTIHDGDAVAVQALQGAAAAFALAESQSCPAANNLTGQNLGGRTLAAGVYCYDGAAQLTGTLTLDGEGPWTFQIAGGLTVDPGARVVAAGVGGTCQGSAVTWQVGGAASSIGAAASFIGNLLASQDVAVAAGASVDGRLVALRGTLTLDANAVAACSAGRPFPPHEAIKVTGGGQLSVPDPDLADHRRGGRGRATFAFRAKPGRDGQPTHGRFVYVNHAVRPHHDAFGRTRVFGRVLNIDVVAVDATGAPTQVRFDGTCTVRPDCTFSVLIEDNGEGRHGDDPDYDGDTGRMIGDDHRQPRPRDRMGVVIVAGGRVVESRAIRPISRGNIKFHRPPAPALTTDLDDVEYAPGSVMSVTASVDAVPSGIQTDAYLVLELPNGQLLSWTRAGLMPGLVPLASGFVPGPYEGVVASVVIPRGAPPGRYTWLSALTVSGTLNLLTPIAETVFTIAP